jgi:hypothetical protein
MRTRTWFASLAVGAVLLAGGPVATAQAAPAPSRTSTTSTVAVASAQATNSGESALCESAAWTFEKDGSSHKISQSAVLHGYGPYAGCPATATIPVNTLLKYDCYTTNPSSGNTWTHVSGNYNGWIWDNYLPDYGSQVHC